MTVILSSLTVNIFINLKTTNYHHFYKSYMKKLLLLLSNILLLNFCYAQQPAAEFSADPYLFKLVGYPGKFKAVFTSEKDDAGLTYLTLKLTAEKKAQPPRLSIKWDIALKNIAGIWTPGRNLTKYLNPGWKEVPLNSRATTNGPVVLLYGYDNLNRFAFACSDALNSINLGAGINETSTKLDVEVQLFNEPQPDIDHYEITIRLDTRPQPYWNTLSEVAKWWENMPAYKPAAVPEHARLPMYSTWYSYHQDFSAKQLEEECLKAKAIGCETIIVDDGWQTLDSSLGYAYTGDWDPLRIPDMRELADHIHRTGMKVMLWYSVPFVGERSKTYLMFKGKYLYYKTRWKAYVLDPRFPEVRKYLIDKYLQALKDWKIDGFKLDFVDSFLPDENTEQTIANGRDYASVNEAVDQLLTDVLLKLHEVKPDIIVEFRQSYIGPLMRKYGNMFRAGDSPYDALSNRVKTTDIRLLSGYTATHSDMLMWNKNEKTEVAALQLLNVIFSVPQISVRLGEIPTAQQQMLKFWLAFWRQNRDVLLDGKFEPSHPDMNYPVITATTDSKQVTALYIPQSVVLIDTVLPAELDVINANLSNQVILDLNLNAGTKTVDVRDCTGKLIATKKISLGIGIHQFDVPPSGLLTIR